MIDQKINEIVQKVRDMYKYDTRFRDHVLKDPIKVAMSYDSDKCESTIVAITFMGYDSISVTDKSITFCPEHGRHETLIRYNSFDDLINEKFLDAH